MELIKQLVELGFKDITKDIFGKPADMGSYSNPWSNTYYVFKKDNCQVSFGLFGKMHHEMSFIYNKELKKLCPMESFTTGELTELLNNLPLMPSAQKVIIHESIDEQGRKISQPEITFY